MLGAIACWVGRRLPFCPTLVVTAAMVSVPAVCGATTITLNPPTQTVGLGDTFSVDVDIIDVIDLYAYQFTIDFNPTLFEATSTAEGPFLPGGTGGNTFPIPGIIDNVGGSITFLADVVVSAGPGATGGGTLAVLGFHAIAPGTGAISLRFDPLNNDFLLDSSFAEIAAQVSGAASVTVNAPTTTVPEPGTLVLMLSGCSAVLRARKLSGPRKITSL